MNRDALVTAVAATTATAAWRVLRARSADGGRWARTNHAGRPVTLLEGPAVVAGVTLGALCGGRAGVPGAVAAAAAGALGAVDDLGPDTADKGLGGHLRALRTGRVTTGAVKVAGLAATGLLSAALLPRRCRDGMADTLVAGALVAGCANLANLLDLRPGRALKAVLLTAVPLLLTGRGPLPPAAAAVGGAVALLPADLRGVAMLGDTGANSAGALVGTALVQRCGRPGRAGALVVVAALTLASERVSFTRVIESTPGLRELDAAGRRRG